MKTGELLVFVLLLSGLILGDATLEAPTQKTLLHPQTTEKRGTTSLPPENAEQGGPPSAPPALRTEEKSTSPPLKPARLVLQRVGEGKILRLIALHLGEFMHIEVTEWGRGVDFDVFV